MIINGDALTELKKLPSDSIDCSITSPPYFNLRSYNAGELEIGTESTLDAYINNLLNIFDEVKRVLKPTGTCWVQIMDTYQNKSLILVPQRLEIGLEDRGWLLRNVIIQRKASCMPSSAKDRFTNCYEHVIFAVKQPRYYFNQQFEPYSSSFLEDKRRKEGYYAPRKAKSQEGVQCPAEVADRIFKSHKNLVRSDANSMHKLRAEDDGTTDFNHYSPLGRNARDVFDINPGRTTLQHFAVMPKKLVKRCIDAGCPVRVCGTCGQAEKPIVEVIEKIDDPRWKSNKGREHYGYQPHDGQPSIKAVTGTTSCECNNMVPGVVLDCFGGVFTVGLVAQRLGIDSVMIELNPEYCEIGRKRLEDDVKKK